MKRRIITLAVSLAALAAASPASATPFGATTLTAPGTLAGASVEPAGDVNGDGHDDLIVGAPAASLPGFPNNGAAWVVYGPVTNDEALSLPAVGARGFRINGTAPTDHLGIDVAGLGDVNGDGFDDVGVAAGGGNQGPAYAAVVFGSATGSDIAIADPMPAGRGYFVWLPTSAYANDDLTRIAGIGDTDGDGRDDVAVTLPGYADAVGVSCDDEPENVCADGLVWVLRGKKSSQTIDVRALGTGGYRIRGRAYGINAGRNVVGVGDVNSDGYDDFAIASPGSSNVWHGEVDVVFGRENGDDFRLDSLGAAGGYRITGPADQQAGLALAAPGDVNGDGRPDLVVASEFSTANGRAWVLFLPPSRDTPIELADLGGTEGYAISGPGPGRRFAFSVGGGDFDGDGLADVAIGAPDADDGGSNSGSVYIVRGSSSAANLSTAALGGRVSRVEGAAANAHIGFSVAAGGDLDGQGRTDLAIGAAAIGTVGIEGLVAPAPAPDTGNTGVGDGGATGPAGTGGSGGEQGGGSGGPAGSGGGDAAPDRAAPRTAIALPACGKRSAATCRRFRRTAAAWKKLTGTASDPGGAVTRVEIALERRSGKKCAVLRGGRLRGARMCGTVVWTRARLSDGAWSMRLPKLPAGRYTARVRATDAAGNVSKTASKSFAIGAR